MKRLLTSKLSDAMLVSRSYTRFLCESLAPRDYIYVYEYSVHAAFFFNCIFVPEKLRGLLQRILSGSCGSC